MPVEPKPCPVLCLEIRIAKRDAGCHPALQRVALRKSSQSFVTETGDEKQIRVGRHVRRIFYQPPDNIAGFVIQPRFIVRVQHPGPGQCRRDLRICQDPGKRGFLNVIFYQNVIERGCSSSIDVLLLLSLTLFLFYSCIFKSI